MSDEDFDPFVGGPPPDPSERTWRHPSEIAAQANAQAAAEARQFQRGRRAITSWRPSSPSGLLLVGSIGAAAFLTVVAVLQVTGKSDQSEPPTAAAPSDQVETSSIDLEAAAGAVVLATTTTTPPSDALTTENAAGTSPILASAVAEQFVGIAIGADLSSGGILVDGYLITSASSIGNQLSVSYSHGDEWSLAYLVGVDRYSDLAVFRPSLEARPGRTQESLASDLENESWDDDVEPMVFEPGDEIISASLTEDGMSASTGFVLATGRGGMTDEGHPLIGLVDTSIRRPDQLGGVLINSAGDVVGIVVNTASSLASAIPVSDAVAIADRLTRQGWANKTWIGFMGVEQDNGVEVIDVTIDGPAANAGLRSGDLIRYLDGARIDHMGGIAAGLRRAAPGDTIAVVVERAGELVALRIQVAAYETSDAAAADGASSVSEPVGG